MLASINNIGGEGVEYYNEGIVRRRVRALSSLGFRAYLGCLGVRVGLAYSWVVVGHTFLYFLVLKLTPEYEVNSFESRNIVQ